jgi:hypothetical protein
MLRGPPARMRALLLMSIMVVAPLSGCFGENETLEVNLNDVLTIDGLGSQRSGRACWRMARGAFAW